MGLEEKTVDLLIPANKFYPPSFASSQHLFRDKLINQTLQWENGGRKVVSIEGQAGQGKTTLALQYLTHGRHQFAWYQFAPEDTDPVFFVTALVSCLKGAVSGFSSPWPEQMIASRTITAPDLMGVLNILLKDLDRAIDGDFYLVFDDMHLLGSGGYTLSLIDYLIDTSPPHIHYLLLSRQSLVLQSKVFKFGRQAQYLTNDDLQLSTDEIYNLFNDIIEVPISREMAHTLQKATGGWAMGLILVGHALKGKEADDVEPFLRQLLRKGAIRDYFLEEIFLQISLAEQQSLQFLSLLENIPLELAQKVCRDDKIGEKLQSLVDHNFFVRRLDNEGKVFAFHQLFQQFLAEEADKRFSREVIAGVFQEAAQFAIKESMPGAALRYLLLAGDFVRMEEFVQQEGMVFLANNRNVTLFGILNQVPPEVLSRHGWLTLFKGLAQYDFMPQTSIDSLVSAQQTLNRQGEEIGELLAIGQIILYHWIISGLLNEGARYLPRAEELFCRVVNQLSPVEKILVTRNIAAGYCYFMMDMDRARYYSAQAMELARQHGIRNYVGATLLLQGYEDFLVARRFAYRKTLEMASDMVLDPSIGTVAQLGLLTLRINELEAYGDFENYFIQENLLEERVGREVVKQTIIGPFLYIWRAGIYVALGEPEKAVMVLESSGEAGSAALNPHLRSQILHWQALALAMSKNDPEKTEALAQESMELRRQCGGPYFIALNKIIIGAAFIYAEKLDEAEKLLTEALRESRRLTNSYLASAASLQRSYCRFLAKHHEECLEDLRQGLESMKNNGYVHFWSWTPAMMRTLLGLAVRQGIEVEYARKLAARRLQCGFLDDGTEIPQLTITILGSFSLGIAGRQILTALDFSPAQRQLLSLLLSSPDQSISQEKVQLIIWPDSAPEKARSKFDTLVSRMRKIIGQAISPLSEKNYISMKKGLLCLDNCWVDAEDFRKKIRTGLSHAAVNEYWHAGNLFQSGMKLWNGCFSTDIFADDQVQEYCLSLKNLFIQASKVWAAHLVDNGSEDAALPLIERAAVFEPLDGRLVQMIYHIYRTRGDKPKARSILNHFSSLLQQEGFPSEEITELTSMVQSGKVIH